MIHSVDASTLYKQVEQIQDKVVEAIATHKPNMAALERRLMQLISTECVSKDLLEKAFLRSTRQKAKCLLLIIKAMGNPTSEKEVGAFQAKYAHYKSQPESKGLQEIENAFGLAMGFIFQNPSYAWPLKDLESSQEIDPDDPVRAWVITARQIHQRCHFSS